MENVSSKKDRERLELYVQIVYFFTSFMMDFRKLQNEQKIETNENTLYDMVVEIIRNYNSKFIEFLISFSYENKIYTLSEIRIYEELAAMSLVHI